MSAPPQEIAPDVYCVPTGKWSSNVYLVRSGSSWVLIDAGWPHCGQAIKEAAESLFGADARPAAIQVTHLHPDHTGSACELARMWNVPVYAHPDEMPLTAEEYPPEYAAPIDRWVIFPLARIWPPFAASLRRRAHETSLKEVARPFDPAAAVPGLPDWSCIHTPGHTPGHVAFFRDRDHVLIAGDALLTININSLWTSLRLVGLGLAGGSFAAFALDNRQVSGPPRISSWSWPAAKASVAALAKLEPSVLACGHGVPMAGAETARELTAFADRFSRP
jgi:glyoxylase-like metal-dependent hydrolase (beta-lactamase superfamily II)